MKITFVGTGSGKTQLQRFHSAVLIEEGNGTVLVDVGDGVSKALLKGKIDIRKITHILITHFHADHFAGLPSLITQMYLSNRTAPLEIFVHENFVDFTSELLTHSYLFPDKLPFDLGINGYEFGLKYQITEMFSFVPVKNSHIKKTLQVVNYPDKLFVSSSFVFEKGNKKLLYTSDLGNNNDVKLFTEKYSTIIIEYTHIDFSSIIELFKYSNPEKLYLTHIDEEKLEELEEYISKLTQEMQGKIFVANDGYIIDSV